MCAYNRDSTKSTNNKCKVAIILNCDLDDCSWDDTNIPIAVSDLKKLDDKKNPTKDTLQIMRLQVNISISILDDKQIKKCCDKTKCEDQVTDDHSNKGDPLPSDTQDSNILQTEQSLLNIRKKLQKNGNLTLLKGITNGVHCLIATFLDNEQEETDMQALEVMFGDIGKLENAPYPIDSTEDISEFDADPLVLPQEEVVYTNNELINGKNIIYTKSHQMSIISSKSRISNEKLKQEKTTGKNPMDKH